MSEIVIKTELTEEEFFDRLSSSLLKNFQPPLPSPAQENDDENLDLAQAAKFLKKSKATVYRYCSKNIIPFSKKMGKCYFKKVELEAWIESGRKLTTAEEIEKIDQYLADKKS